MCDKCKFLAKCIPGEARTDVVAEATERKAIKIDKGTLYFDGWYVRVEKNEDGTGKGYLYQRVYDGTLTSRNDRLEITHCPFCGKRLVKTKRWWRKKSETQP